MRRKGEPRNDPDVVAFLLARYGRGGEAAPRTPPPGVSPDENDLAATPRGALLPGREAALRHALARGRAWREAVSFASGTLPHEGRRRALPAAAVVLALLAVLSPLLLPPRDLLGEAQDLLAQGEPTRAVTMLAELHELNPRSQTAQLLALARFASGEDHPARGLDLRLEDSDFLPPSRPELALWESRILRGPVGEASLVLAPRGLILDSRPRLEVAGSSGLLRLTLYRTADQQALWRAELAPSTEPRQMALPGGLPDLELGARHGIELRDAAGDLVAHGDFLVAAAAMKETVQERAELLSRCITDPTRRAWALGNLYLHHGLHQMALEVLATIPVEVRPPVVEETLRIVGNHLQGQR